MKFYSNYFDVLNINHINEDVEIIQSFLSNICLGTYIENNLAKIYFCGGDKDKVEVQLQNIKRGYNFEWKWEKQKKEDWHLAWQENFVPVIIDEKLSVIPSWQSESSEEIIIKIKPGMAFGTGHHETTWLMLSQLIKNIKKGMSVLDLGSGSGILSIAAIKLGAKNIDSVEYDSDCKENFNENLILNNINNNIHYHDKDVLKWDDYNYDLILANINFNIIVDLIPKFRGSNTKIILSGLLDIDYIKIKDHCSHNKMKIIQKFQKGEWICLIIDSF